LVIFGGMEVSDDFSRDKELALKRIRPFVQPQLLLGLGVGPYLDEGGQFHDPPTKKATINVWT
jgi:hypothetical protein